MILGKHGFHQVAGALQAPFTTTLRRLLRREPAPVIQQPERLRMVLEDLGPTFIKFGQLLSTRPDLLPPEYIEELGRLQDKVRPAPFEEILALLEDEFQTDARKLFASIDSEPLASASIAQVHRATTLGGEAVVVKVRKKGLERLVKQDLQVLALLAEFLSGWRGLRLFDTENVVRWFERSIQRELNFDYERYNILRIRKNLEEDSRLCIPRVYPQLSRRGVLTLEYLEGKKLTQVQSESLDPDRARQISTDIALCILKQVFEHGMYHADPHPGNIIIMPDGRVGLLDFGNVGRFNREMKEDLLQVLVALIRRNYRDVSRWVLKRGQPPKGVDVHGLALELMDTLDPYYGLSLEEIQLGGMFNSLFEIALRHDISIPAPYVHVGRTFVILEGVVRRCSPQMALIPAIQPYMAEVLQKRWSPDRLLRDLEGDLSDLFSALRSCPTNLAEVLGRAAEGRFRLEAGIPEVQKLGERLDQASHRVQLAVLSSGLLISSSILLFMQTADAWSLQKVLGIAGFVVGLLLMLRLWIRG
jgi:ubiquinone biosynthesis protein